jgi:superfamily II DNA or RNA helicase
MKDRKDIALIATYGIFQQGINIPNLKYIILASPFKSKIRVLQSIGRALISHAYKENGAYIFDLHDHTTFFEKHGNIRYRYYDSEKFKIDEYLFEEGNKINLKDLKIN